MQQRPHSQHWGFHGELLIGLQGVVRKIEGAYQGGYELSYIVELRFVGSRAECANWRHLSHSQSRPTDPPTPGPQFIASEFRFIKRVFLWNTRIP